MNRIDFVITAIFKATAGFTALVGNKLFPVGNVPQAENLPNSPFIVYGSETEPLQDKDGAITTHVGKFQFDSYGTDQEVLKNITELLESTYQNYSGVVGSIKVDSFQSLGSVPAEWNTDYQLFIQSIEFNFWIQQI